MVLNVVGSSPTGHPTRSKSLQAAACRDFTFKPSRPRLATNHTVYIDPDKGTVRILLDKYADSIPLEEFCIEDQIVIYEELAKRRSQTPDTIIE